METIWKQELTIHWEKTDISGKLSLPGLGQLLINTATQHAEMLGFGFEALKEQNLNWVLFRMNIEIKRLPLWNEPVTLTTWPLGIKGLAGLREFVMHDNAGRELCNATSEWLIIDLDTRRPKRLNQFDKLVQYNHNKKAFTGVPPVADTKAVFKDLFSITARHSDMDFNGHATARGYFDWLDDGLYLNNSEREIKMIQVTFFQETYINDVLILQSDETGTTVKGIKRSDGKTAFMAAVVFKD